MDDELCQASANEALCQQLTSILYNTQDQTPSEPETTLYGVLDGAAIDGLWGQLDRWGIPHASLFEEEEQVKTRTVSPYVVELTKDHEASQALLNQYGHNNSIYLQSTLPLDELQDYLKGFFRIINADGQPALFRFYSPSVFRGYVLKSGEDYLCQFFYSITSCFVEDSDQTVLTQYRWYDGSLQQHAHLLTETNPPTDDSDKQSGML